MKKYNINILGTTYTIYLYEENDKFPSESNSGLCISSKKEIHVDCIKNNLANAKVVQMNILKHEVIHAFFYESGLDLAYSGDETLVDWIALQLDKIKTSIETIMEVKDS